MYNLMLKESYLLMSLVRQVMTEEQLKKEKKKESNKKYQEKLKANLRLLKTEKNDLRWSQIEEFLVTPQAIFWITITFVGSLLSLILFFHRGSTLEANKGGDEYSSIKTKIEGLRTDLSQLRMERCFGFFNPKHLSAFTNEEKFTFSEELLNIV